MPSYKYRPQVPELADPDSVRAQFACAYAFALQAKKWSAGVPKCFSPAFLSLIVQRVGTRDLRDRSPFFSAIKCATQQREVAIRTVLAFPYIAEESCPSARAHECLYFAPELKS